MNLSFFCKIRPNSFEIRSDSLSKTTEKPSISPKSRSPNKKTLCKNTQNIFTTNSETSPSRLVIANENPIKTKLINSYFRTEKSLSNYTNTILKKAQIFNFDGVFDINYRFFKRKKTHKNP